MTKMKGNINSKLNNVIKTNHQMIARNKYENFIKSGHKLSLDQLRNLQKDLKDEYIEDTRQESMQIQNYAKNVKRRVTKSHEEIQKMADGIKHLYNYIYNLNKHNDTWLKDMNTTMSQTPET